VRHALARAALLPAALLAFLAGSCGRAPRPGGTLDDAATRYAVARDHREALLGALAGEWTVRADGRGTGRLPTLPATLELAAPDRVRLRVSALVGTALDVLVTRDSLHAWIPSRRLAFAAPGESLGIGAPAAFAGRVFGATWSPPRDAWRAAGADSGGWRVGWREGGDTLSLLVGADGRPAEAWFGRDARGVRVRYTGWTQVRGEPFPQRCELEDDSRWVRVRLDALDVRAPERPDDGWFTPRRTSGWRTMTWGDLRSVLERRGLP
jgi:hypothetical protein